MEIIIKDGKFTITGQLQPPVRSKSGKTYIVASTGGFMNVQGDNKQYQVALNIITKESK